MSSAARRSEGAPELRPVDDYEKFARPLLVVGAAKMSEDFPRRSAAFSALAAIVRVTRTQAVDLLARHYATEALRVRSAAGLRLNAAQALSASKHPGTSKALLGLQDDPDDSVRLTVLHHAAKLGG